MNKANATKPWGQSVPKSNPDLSRKGAASVAKTSPWKPMNRRGPPSTADIASRESKMRRSAATRPW